jgi:hypothetical protein
MIFFRVREATDRKSASVELLQTGEIFALWSERLWTCAQAGGGGGGLLPHPCHLLNQKNKSIKEKEKSTNPEGKGRNTKRGPKSKDETTPKSEREEKKCT